MGVLEPRTGQNSGIYFLDPPSDLGKYVGIDLVPFITLTSSGGLTAAKSVSRELQDVHWELTKPALLLRNLS